VKLTISLAAVTFILSGLLSADEIRYLTGNFSPAKNSKLLEFKPGFFLRKEAYAAFLKMAEKAKKDGFQLEILSATRNFNSQKSIWNEKWNGRRLVEGKNLAQNVKDPVSRAKIILKYSSMPGTSRHHWGTDIDLNSLNPDYFHQPAGKALYRWLEKNAKEFGFCQPYTPLGPNRPTGYQEEKWHWSYTPISRELLRQYQHKVSYTMLQGFQGDYTAAKLNVIENYVLSINPECK